MTKTACVISSAWAGQSGMTERRRITSCMPPDQFGKGFLRALPLGNSANRSHVAHIGHLTILVPMGGEIRAFILSIFAARTGETENKTFYFAFSTTSISMGHIGGNEFEGQALPSARFTESQS